VTKWVKLHHFLVIAYLHQLRDLAFNSQTDKTSFRAGGGGELLSAMKNAEKRHQNMILPKGSRARLLAAKAQLMQDAGRRLTIVLAAREKTHA